MNIKIPSLALPDKIFGIDGGLVSSFIPLVVAVILAIVGTNLIITPQFTNLSESNKKLTLLNLNSKNLLDKTRYLQSIDQTEMKKNSDFIANSLLPQQNAYLLVGVVRKIADEFSFQVDSFSISPGKLEKNEAPSTAKLNGVPKIPISVTLVGPKTAYLDLIKGFERSLPILSLNSFKMTTSGELVKLDLDINAFYLQDSNKFDINKLTLADLTMKKEETDLLTTLNEYTVLENFGDIENSNTTKTEFKKYTRTDPFSL